MEHIESTPVILVPGRLLVVDDHADGADILGELLREEGYEVSIAYDAPTAIELARQFQPTIALVDLALPQMDGYELARHLRDRVAGLQFVAVSGYGDPADLQKSAAAGFHAHLGKPLDFDKLVMVLDELRPSARKIAPV
ncbi:MAG: Chemotaxis protein methyltransferase CheR [Myxococcales bacterium]|nr:Chemotaxis protein methyltransferase CheR [Myxococcales bacterium]